MTLWRFLALPRTRRGAASGRQLAPPSRESASRRLLKATTREPFARLAQPIDFHAVDDLPVDIVFMLLSPVDAGALHLKALARVSRRLRERAFVDKLRGAASRDAIYALLTADEARDAA